MVVRTTAGPPPLLLSTLLILLAAPASIASFIYSEVVTNGIVGGVQDNGLQAFKRACEIPLRLTGQVTSSEGVFDEEGETCTRPFDMIYVDGRPDSEKSMFCSTVDPNYMGQYQAMAGDASKFECVFTHMVDCPHNFLAHRGMCVHISTRELTYSEAVDYCNDATAVGHRSHFLQLHSTRQAINLAGIVSEESGMVWAQYSGSRAQVLDLDGQESPDDRHAIVMHGGMQPTTQLRINYIPKATIVSVPKSWKGRAMCTRSGNLAMAAVRQNCEVFWRTMGMITSYDADKRECVFSTMNNYPAEFRSMRVLHSYCEIDRTTQARAYTSTMLNDIDPWMKTQYGHLYKAFESRVREMYGLEKQKVDDMLKIPGKGYGFTYSHRVPLFMSAQPGAKATWVDETGKTFIMPDGKGVRGRASETLRSFPGPSSTPSGKEMQASKLKPWQNDLNGIVRYNFDNDFEGYLDWTQPLKRLPVLCIARAQVASQVLYKYFDCPRGFAEFTSSHQGRTCIKLNSVKGNPALAKLEALPDWDGEVVSKSCYDTFQNYCKNMGAELAQFVDLKELKEGLEAFSGMSADSSFLDSLVMIDGYRRSADKKLDVNNPARFNLYEKKGPNNKHYPAAMWNPGEPNGNGFGDYVKDMFNDGFRVASGLVCDGVEGFVIGLDWLKDNVFGKIVGFAKGVWDWVACGFSSKESCEFKMKEERWGKLSAKCQGSRLFKTGVERCVQAYLPVSGITGKNLDYKLNDHHCCGMRRFTCRIPKPLERLEVY